MNIFGKMNRLERQTKFFVIAMLLLEILTFISANVYFIKVNIDLVELKTIYCMWEVRKCNTTEFIFMFICTTKHIC